MPPHRPTHNQTARIDATACIRADNQRALDFLTTPPRLEETHNASRRQPAPTPTPALAGTTHPLPRTATRTKKTPATRTTKSET
jgi:hypothetical protein